MAERLYHQSQPLLAKTPTHGYPFAVGLLSLMKQNIDYYNVLVETITEKKVATRVRVGPTLLPPVVIFIVCWHTLPPFFW